MGFCKFRLTYHEPCVKIGASGGDSSLHWEEKVHFFNAESDEEARTSAIAFSRTIVEVRRGGVTEKHPLRVCKLQRIDTIPIDLPSSVTSWMDTEALSS